MLDHHIQRTIVYTLAFAESMRFGELKPDELDNKLFNYHLKKVIAAGYVAKNDEGLYTLTSEGKRVGKGALKKQSRLIDRAYSILLLCVRRESDGAWLLVRRRTQPLLGLKGFMQAQAGERQRCRADGRRRMLGADWTYRYVRSAWPRVFPNLPR